MLFALLPLIDALPTLNTLTLRPDGVATRQFGFRRDVKWRAVTNITEELWGGRSRRWYVLLRVRKGNAERKVYIPDVYSLRRPDLLSLMQSMWREAQADGTKGGH